MADMIRITVDSEIDVPILYQNRKLKFSYTLVEENLSAMF